ncbi:hypothetical protein NECAME_02543 [Necator americanus]|uniref:Uncharacterized protein n=1 Tax=Necator americanus TaxID=51031 RepID=W2TCE1_NECAM|nr:hypothetical protein NECAME_02543 [Necator americanus]ETN79720.1 hypothetical protein NECAME_02543 [Necator americanus]
MKSIGFLLLFTALYVYAQRKCGAGNECPPGQACRDGICHGQFREVIRKKKKPVEQILRSDADVWKYVTQEFF